VEQRVTGGLDGKVEWRGGDTTQDTQGLDTGVLISP
jgi:hypothetical protein